MKYFMIALLLFFLVSISLALPPIRVTDNAVEYPKWIAGGNLYAWTDAERDSMVANTVNTGTGTVVKSDFVLVTVSTTDQKTIDDYNTSGVIPTRSGVIKKLGK